MDGHAPKNNNTALGVELNWQVMYGFSLCMFYFWSGWLLGSSLGMRQSGRKCRALLLAFTRYASVIPENLDDDDGVFSSAKYYSHYV